MSNGVLYWGLAVLAAYQLYATVRVLVSVQYSRLQKLVQVALIWAIPFIGAVACHIFLTADTRRLRQRDSAFIPDGGNSPSGIGSDSHSN
jgi:hypothetical protein